ncbi:putative Glucose-1-phosphate thymidylyltransferase [Streptomyces afghaniensis 772] [Streptomyces afghaniensis]
MKALVLSGGAGTRLEADHTHVGQATGASGQQGRAFLWVGVDRRGRHHRRGHDRRGHGRGDRGSGGRRVAQFGLKVTYIPQERPLGLAHAVLIARDYLGDDDFVMYLGDNFIVGGITDLVNEFRGNRPDAQILLTRVADPRAFGVAELDPSGQVIGLEEKPDRPKSDLALVGVYLFTPLIHEAVRAIEPSWRGELEITHAIQHLIDSRADVRSTVITGYWKDTGNVGDMLEVNRMVLEGMDRRIDGDADTASETIGRVVVEEGARIVNSRIVGPAVIGAGTVISNSYVGPFTSIAENCRITDSELEFSIVLRDSSIQGVGRIEASLIGRHVEVTPAPSVPSAHRFVLGDHSKVQITS